MKILAIVSIPVAFMVISCSPASLSSTVYSESYVLTYYDLTGIELDMRGYGTIELLALTSGGEIYSNSKNTSYYKLLSEKHNDLSYNRKVKVEVAPPNNFISHDFISLEITSNRDFDKQHPAGHTLSDVTEFYGLSPFPYIQQGYKDFDWKNYEYLDVFKEIWGVLLSESYKSQGWGCLYPIKAMITDLGPDDLKILGDGDIRYNGIIIGNVTFTKGPESEKQHNITITLTNDKGYTFSDSITVNFE